MLSETDPPCHHQLGDPEESSQWVLVSFVDVWFQLDRAAQKVQIFLLFFVSHFGRLFLQYMTQKKTQTCFLLPQEPQTASHSMLLHSNEMAWQQDESLSLSLG